MSFIPGTPDSEGIPGTQFDDLISAYGGNDSIYAFGGNDTLYGGQGDDSLLGQFGNDLIFGEGGNDRLEAGGDSDQLFGGDGNDFILVNDLNYDGESTGYGGAGDDFLAVFGSGHGTLFGGDGIDTLQLANPNNNPLFVDLIAGTLDGHGSFPGVTFAEMERLNVLTFDGNDSVYGGNREDRLLVGMGDNMVDAKAGNDYVSYITRGASTLEGGAGIDTLGVSGGTASLYFIYDSFEGDFDDGQGSSISGFERYEAYGGAHADVVGLGLGNDLFRGSYGSDTAFGNDGRDRLYGDGGRDSLEGGAGRDTLFGGAGVDTIFGGDGNDVIGGGIGRDEVYGGDGDDLIRLGVGDDYASGGLGRDTFAFIAAPVQNSDTYITDFKRGVDHLQFDSALLLDGPSAGPLDPSLLSFGTLHGNHAQFFAFYMEEYNHTAIEWLPNPIRQNNVIWVYLEGNIHLTASDFLIV